MGIQDSSHLVGHIWASLCSMASTRFPSALPPHAPPTSERVKQLPGGQWPSCRSPFLFILTGSHLLLYSGSSGARCWVGMSIFQCASTDGCQHVSSSLHVDICRVSALRCWATSMHSRGTSPLTRILYASHQVRVHPCEQSPYHSRSRCRLLRG